jgi:hypothetical protein
LDWIPVRFYLFDLVFRAEELDQVEKIMLDSLYDAKDWTEKDAQLP